MCYSYCKGNSNLKYINKSSHYPTLINIYYYILNKHTANNICYIVRYLISLVDIYLLYILYCIWANWEFDRKMGTTKYLKLKHTQTTEIEGNLDREM